jgi:hypothetical protein
MIPRLLVLVVVLAVATPAFAQVNQVRPSGIMQAFASDAELEDFVDRLRENYQREARERVGTVVPRAAVPTEATQATDATDATDESITNVQHDGLDEGGIVKRHGDHLVVLRRGRLFSVRIADDALQPIDMIDAFAPDIDPRRAWYDEVLIIDDWIAVIGYSYQRSGTEIGIFSIDGFGRLAYHSTYHLRSDDYYSVRNYASRVVDGRLIFYAPLRLKLDAPDFRSLYDALPALRRWEGRRARTPFRLIASATTIYRPARELNFDDLALHAVTSCAIDAGELSCEATAVFGPFSHTFYVSPEAVYVWLSSLRRSAGSPMIYRLPLNGGAPSAVGARGGPIDQFSFQESADGHLNVLVSATSDGQWMDRSENPQSNLALLRFPIWEFGDGSRDVLLEYYRAVPDASDYRSDYRSAHHSDHHSVVNRFIGDHLVYGQRQWGYTGDGRSGVVHVVHSPTAALSSVDVGHQAERIEALGAHALVVGGSGEDLRFTSLRLNPGTATMVSQYRLERGAQTEWRSHGFFYRQTGEDEGVLGLPIRVSIGRSMIPRLNRPRTNALITYVRNSNLTLSPLGSLRSGDGAHRNDGCRASCEDWYGNARPIFLGDRVFALMGYEIIEGWIGSHGIREVRRVDFGPEPGR